MKILPLVFCCAALAAPPNNIYMGSGFLIDNSAVNSVYIVSTGEMLQKDIRIEVKTGKDKKEIIPEENAGYEPQVFLGDFMNNGLEQIFYSVGSGGSGAFSYYQLFSLKDGRIKELFNSNTYSLSISYKLQNGQVVIQYQNQTFYLSEGIKECEENCEVYVSDVNAIFPTCNTGLNKYQLLVYQRVWIGFAANTVGYLTSLLDINDEGYQIVNMGTCSNFEYKIKG